MLQDDITRRLKPNTTIRGLLFPEPVTVIVAFPMGDRIKLVATGVESGRTYQPILTAENLNALEFPPESQVFDGNPEHFRWGLEALRLGLAHEYDPYFALSIARIDPLPHQLEAVYDYFIRAPRIRFLLADDPGAGKTIMAGLLIQELKARGLIRRTLIVAPANLTFQWQRELKDKFRQQFDVLNGAVLRSQYGSNPWQEREQVITSISWVSRIEDARDSLLRSQWDLVIVDEAHKMSAYAVDSKTLAYQLGERLGERTDHYLLMTATPHKGNPEHFALFLRLLDQDVYGDVKSLEEAMRRNEAPFYLRRVKEALVTFPNPDTGEVKTLFTKRTVNTVEFQIDDEEADFYDALTHFVEDQSVQAAAEGGARGRAIGFTMAMLQRRFASSLYAVRRTLERMRTRREKILEDPEGYIREQIARRVPDDFDELPEDEQAGIIADLEESVISIDPDVLREEIFQLTRLINQAHRLESRETETKLRRLRAAIVDYRLFEDPRMRLLIFTEHKDTLDYLAGDGKEGRPYGKLRAWGLSVTTIHGSMPVGDRDMRGSRIYAEREFKESCQILVATEAAGEGINLQFCWFMINYDIPWNPVRLEQRMGRIHRYGQEHDCLILNFVTTNTREGRVLAKLFERVRLIEAELDPHSVGKVFNVLGDVFPANELERMVRDMYARNQTEDRILDRIVQEVDLSRFQRITNSTLEGLAKREINLAAVVGKSAEARERRLVPEVIEEFFKEAAPLIGLSLRSPARGKQNFYHLGRVPRALAQHGPKLEPRFGRLGNDYPRITFDKDALQDDAALEWVTPGHPLFEALREETWQRAQPALEHGALFFDLQRAEPACLDVFTAAIHDGNGKTLHERLFVVETQLDGAQQVRQPTLFHTLTPAVDQVAIPEFPDIPIREQAEQLLIEQELGPLLVEVKEQREHEVDVVRRHMDISLAELLNRQNVRLASLLQRQQEGDTDPLVAANIKQTSDRIEELDARRDQRRRELERERLCSIGAPRHLGRAWALPHPERDALHLAPMVSNAAIERSAVQAVIAELEGQGWSVESVETDNRGFDLIARKPHPDRPNLITQERFIEVKGRAGLGVVALSSHEYRTAHRLKDDYWLYAVFNCATAPEIYAIRNPARLEWEPMESIVQYRVGYEHILNEAARHRQPASPVIAAFEAAWASRIDSIGPYNILVEGETDKMYLELAAQRHREAGGEDLLDGGAVRIIAGRGTKKFAPEFGLLQSLEQAGSVRFVVILDGDASGSGAAEVMGRFSAQKNRHFFQLERPDFKDKAGRSWDVEIEDMLPWPTVQAFIQAYPEAVEEQYQRGDVHKVIIQGKPLVRDGATYDFKMMLAEYVRQHATAQDMQAYIAVLRRARQCMGLS